MKAIRVLWVTNALGFGGAERQMLYMYSIIKQYCNIDVTILFYARVDDELIVDNVNTVYIDKRKTGKIKLISEISKYIRDNDIDIVHALGGNSANIYGRIGAIFTKAVPVGAVLGKKHFSKLPLRLANSLLNLCGNWWTVNNRDLVPILKHDLKFVSLAKVRLLHNGFVPAEKIDYQHRNMTEYDIDKGDCITFAVAGRLQPVKNYSLFLAAAREIIKRHDRVRFWIVGNGPEYEKLNNLISEYGLEKCVRMWGYRTDVDIMMDRADVFVQTSNTEGSPNTIAEAMRARKPVISTRSTDLSEMIHDGRNGYIVPVNDCMALVDAMEKIIACPQQERSVMGSYSYQLFEENFLDKKVAGEFQSFYEKVLQRKG